MVNSGANCLMKCLFTLATVSADFTSSLLVPMTLSEPVAIA
jgi:hypothetical protein